MAGGGSSELKELYDMVRGIIREMEERIAVLEDLLPMDPLPGGGTSGEKSASKSKVVKASPKPRKRSKKGAKKG